MVLKMWVLVFAKYPEPGRVNTRLCPPLSPVQAAEVQAACVRHVLAQVQASEASRLILVVSPDETQEACRTAYRTNVEVWPQGEGDLGARLTRASRRAFDSGASGVMFLGADSPTLPWSLLDALPKTLRMHDASLGPCDDGGYYYLAMAEHHPKLLRNIAWGTPRVVEQTRQRAREAGLRLHEAEVGYDIDHIADLRRAATDLDAADQDCELREVICCVLRDLA